MPSKCFFSTAVEGERGKHKKGRHNLGLCIAFNFLFSLNTWDFIFKTSTPNWKNRLKSYWRRHFFIPSALPVLSSREAGAGDSCTGTHWSILQRTCQDFFQESRRQGSPGTNQQPLLNAAILYLFTLHPHTSGGNHAVLPGGKDSQTDLNSVNSSRFELRWT